MSDGMREAHGRMVYEITLGRTDIQRASNNGLEVPREKLRQCDTVIIHLGPDLEKVNEGEVAKIVDRSSGLSEDG